MPICEFTTFIPKSGKFSEAHATALVCAEYLNANIDGARAEVWINIDGRRDLIHWVVRYDSLAEYEKASAQFRADEGARKLRAPFHEYTENPQARETHFYRIEG